MRAYLKMLRFRSSETHAVRPGARTQLMMIGRAPPRSRTSVGVRVPKTSSARQEKLQVMSDDFITLWESEAASRHAPSQTGASNCGETSVKASLMALKIPESPGGGVTVRARDYSTRSLCIYLKSRALAGCTGADLVDGAHSLSGGRAQAKFFACGPEPPVGLTKWLAEWLARGAAPIVTINTQLDGADYWHHQAVLGVRQRTQEIALANPCETVAESELARLLGSPSVMLVMPSDVLQRCPPSAEELNMLRSEPRWAALDVAGNVERLIEDKDRGSASADGRLAIPASYLPGVTLICQTGSEAAKLLQEADSPWRPGAVHEAVTEAM